MTICVPTGPVVGEAITHGATIISTLFISSAFVVDPNALMECIPCESFGTVKVAVHVPNLSALIGGVKVSALSHVSFIAFS